MRVININFETITDYDLSVGKLIPTLAVKESAEPIDNVKKYAWGKADWEKVLMFVQNPTKTPSEEIAELKSKLRESDYHILKIVEGATTLMECAEIIRKRAQWRKEINELEQIDNGN